MRYWMPSSQAVLPDRPGYFIAPTTVPGIEDGGRLADEESFSPLPPVVKDQG